MLNDIVLVTCSIILTVLVHVHHPGVRMRSCRSPLTRPWSCDTEDKQGMCMAVFASVLQCPDSWGCFQLQLLTQYFSMIHGSNIHFILTNVAHNWWWDFMSITDNYTKSLGGICYCLPPHYSVWAIAAHAHKMLPPLLVLPTVFVPRWRHSYDGVMNSLCIHDM